MDMAAAELAFIKTQRRIIHGRAANIVYTGPEMAGFLPPAGAAQFIRGIPRAFDLESDASRSVREKLFPDYQILNDETYYVAAASTLESFSSISEVLKPGDKIIVLRDMGLGDVLLSLPTVKEIKRRLPDNPITYATLPRYIGLVTDYDFIDEAVSMHDVDLESGEYQLIINFCRSLESYRIDRNRGRRVDSFAKLIGINDGLHDGINVVAPILKSSHREKAMALLPGGERYIGYVLKAAAWNRSYPVWKAHKMLEALHEQFPRHEIAIIDNQPFKLHKDIPYVIDLCGDTADVLEAAAVCERCDAIVSPDTGMAHMAAALVVPTVVMLSSMPFEWRYDHYGPHCIGVDTVGSAACVPCWDWQRDRGRITYCSKTFDNVCMHSMDPKFVAAAVAEAIERGTK